MKNPRIEIANLTHKIKKTTDEDGRTVLKAFANYVGPCEPFNVCVTTNSDHDGLAVTLCLSSFETFEQAAAALLRVVSDLPADEQKAAHESIINQRTEAEAVESRIKHQDRWVVRKLELQAQRDEKRRLGYVD
ncbi:hypothetical protein [Caballeronia sp. AZ1_KS37]|uniref:hypothetical protein n=1 Tax=Caballeronia sp. AZ1_KS37 TaxID=2921756 RepID=UPI002027F8F3|nr:hypothetical protein [Caballeronia sp. AZ1_KS37]